tara:strand:- start:663 stop:1382 length:720 start_codon:yes stop_codon:yes gene_type:complete
MKLIWTYSKDFKKGNLNNVANHKYIQTLFQKAIKTAPSQYEKIIYTDEDTVGLFEGIVDQVIVREKKDFIFLADLKFDIAEKMNGEFIVSDGDLFINKPLLIPFNVDMAFEYKSKVEDIVYGFKEVLLKENIHKNIPIWATPNKQSWNLGLMYFNNNKLKNKLIEEYRKTQSFFIEKIEPKYRYNKNNKQFSACASQMLVEQFNLNNNCKIGEFGELNGDKYVHYGNKRKLDLIKKTRI